MPRCISYSPNHCTSKNSAFADEIVYYFNDELARRKVTIETGEAATRAAIVRLLADKYSAGDYLRLLEEQIDLDPYLDIDDEIFDSVGEIRDTRGSLVHNFTSIFEAGDRETVHEQAAQCQALVTALQTLLREQLLVNEEFAEMLAD